MHARRSFRDAHVREAPHRTSARVRSGRAAARRLPSRCAASPSKPLAVTTPVPPTPAIKMLCTAWTGRLRRLRQARQRLRRERSRRHFACALQRDEARTKTLQTAEVLIARRLIDAALAPELGLERHDRQAVRLDVAVAATFAYELVDHDPAIRRNNEVAFALAMQLRRTGLIVNQRRDAAHLAQLPLQRIELAAVVHGGVRG